MGSFFDEMYSCFDRWNRKLDEISDETRVMDDYVTSLEHGARQPRLAMEAHGHANTKTQERTEGAATAVQAMRGDSFTTAQKVHDGPKTSITFGVEAEPPDLPCREDILVEDGATAPKSCLPSLEMHTTTAVGGLVSTGKTFTATETNLNQPPLRFFSTEETDLKAICKKTQLHTSRTTAAVPGDCLLFPTAGGSLGLNPGKIGLLIQAVCKVISAPALFWDRGARWFVVRLNGLGQLVTSCSVFSEETRWFSETRPALMSCKKKSSRLERLEVIGKGANGCRGASWSQQLDGNFAKRTPAFGMSQCFKAIRPFLHHMVC